MAKRKAADAGISWPTLVTGVALGVALALGVRAALDFFAPGVVSERTDSITYENPEAQELSFRFFDMLTQSDVIDTTRESGQPLPPVRATESKPTPAAIEEQAPVATADASEAQPTMPTIPFNPPVAAPAEPAPATVTGARFLLQAGSFRGSDKAEVLRARILLLGLPSRTQQVTVQGGGIWYRVFVGPYDTKQQMEQAAAQLRAQDIDPLPLYRAA
ncbi:MAG: SPOR domain-containing protein [Gammaproteobacteria bacterium]|nr:SPOR domain-containing protein [Gammaproteobacteria bacterium]